MMCRRVVRSHWRWQSQLQRGSAITTHRGFSSFSELDRVLEEKLPREAAPDFDKPLLMVAPVVLTHGVLGSLLSYPVIAEALTREVGVLESVAGDWDILETSLPLSTGLMLTGLVSSFFGSTMAEMGPRKALLGSSVAIGGGLAVSALGVYSHTLPLLYLGFGTSVGAGVALSFASPIQTLMSWFPSNKGICGGVAASSLGLGAVLSREFLEQYLKVTMTLPQYLGPSEQFEILGSGKDLSVQLGEKEGLTSVVHAIQGEVMSTLPVVEEGLYAVGSGGSTGAAGALSLMSVVSFSALAVSALMIRLPPKEFADDKSELFISPMFKELTDRDSISPIAPDNRTDEAALDFFSLIRSRNFHVLGGMLACTATSGLGLLTLSDAIIIEEKEYGRLFPELITPTFLNNQALGLCAAGIFGAGFWPTLSDFVGSRKSLVMMYFITSPAFLAIPLCSSLAFESESTYPVFLSVGAAAVAATSIGGIIGTMPAYCAEIFGTKNVTASQSALLVYTTLAATFAPYLYVKLHQLAEQNAYQDLLSKVSPELFQEAFGSSIDGAQSLILQGSISVSDLFSITPSSETMDPTPFLYDTTLYSFACLMTLSAISNALIVEPQVTKVVDSTAIYTPLPEKIKKRQEYQGKQYIDRRKKKNRHDGKGRS